MDQKKSVEMLREVGKAYFFKPESDAEKRNKGMQMLIQAQRQGDSEAEFIVSRLILDGILTIPKENFTEVALALMCQSANKGFVQARAFLNAYCEKRYAKEFNKISSSQQEGPLVDFDGQIIKIARTGVLTPIDAVLEYKNGKNILTLSANIEFVYDEEKIADPERFEDAIITGIRLWQGEYSVFNGQKVLVEMKITTEPRVFDNVIVAPLTSDIENAVKSLSRVIVSKQSKARIKNVLASKRSFAMNGLKWSTKSRKIICIQSYSREFDNYDEIMHIAKHEFGHALGLGDLYQSPTDSLTGVKTGTYSELDGYAISDKFYNLVMCDHHGPISNNDIEMVILAFRENKMQMFQPMKIKGEISYALGRGN